MAAEVAEWREFFVTTATVAGALVGLLFVAVSVHLRVLSDEHYADLRDNARAILLGYVVSMPLSLFPLIPQSLSALGAEIQNDAEILIMGPVANDESGFGERYRR